MSPTIQRKYSYFYSYWSKYSSKYSSSYSYSSFFRLPFSFILSNASFENNNQYLSSVFYKRMFFS
ncbi:hypothetical protein BpHYR1_003375 [Brachionus plicatilis]|uniref:Uncharacterized protein n=1 Tax=Brachionus plicatilis TaxID=10195 RepID=A0A3M7SY54_BRAPC|nr:hypothetical protein BpHYR1_003375 [Brachionus plicatilis]